jgi:hypothetical protein
MSNHFHLLLETPQGNFCPWESKSGQGGPTMDPEQMKILGKLNIELGFEFWYCEEKE